MNKVKPWVYGPVELLQHAEGHLQSGEDFDRRMALISYDNSIEVSITTFLNLHPDQRGGKTFKREDVNKWLRDFHTKLEFLEEYVHQLGKPMQVMREEFIWYHRRRNELYHGESGFVPPERDIQGVREAALWVFSTLFEVDAENLLLQQESPLVPVPREQTLETYFLEAFVEIRRDLNTLLRVVGITDPSDTTQVDAEQAWNLLATQPGDWPSQYEGTIHKAEALRDRLVEDDSTLQDEKELRALTSDIRQVSALIDTQLREYQQRIVSNAVAATLEAAAPQGDRRAGIVWQTLGSGLSVSVFHYVARIIEANHFTVVVVTDRSATSEQLFASFASYEAISLPPATLAMSTEHLIELLGKEDGIIFTTIQKFHSVPVFYDCENTIVVVYDVLSLGRYMMSLKAILPNATYVLFTSTPIKVGSRTSEVFGEFISRYDWREAIKGGHVVPVYLETRSFAIDESQGNHVYSTDRVAEVKDEEIWNLRRVQLLAKDIVAHFESRLEAVNGKGMIAVAHRTTAIGLFREIVRLRPDWHSDDSESTIEVVITGTQFDPPEWQQYICDKAELQMLAERFRDPDSQLKMVITSGLWLTGMDVPSLHTLYLCRPMRGHMLLQAMARVSRVSEGKQNGLIVDYWGGLASEFEKALKLYEKWTGESADE